MPLAGPTSRPVGAAPYPLSAAGFAEILLMRGRTHLTIGLLAAAGAVALRPDLTGYSLTGVVVAGMAQFTNQCIAVGATIVFSAVATFVLLKLVDVVIGLRVTEDEEREGLDVVLHGERLG